MQKKKSWPHKLWKRAKTDYFITAIVVIIFLVGLIAAYKIVNAEDEYIYARIKISQGLWWANTAKPSIWMVDAIQKGDVATTITGKPKIEVLAVRRYPWWDSDEHLVYITARMKVSKNEKRGTYTYDRSTIGVGSPIDLEFPDVQVSGTIIELSEKPIKHHAEMREVTIVKKWAEPWEYEGIRVGDIYNNGEENVFEILDKKITYAQAEYLPKTGYNYPAYSEPKVHITVTANMLIHPEGKKLIFGEEQVLRLGKRLNFATNSYTFADYFVTHIEQGAENSQ